METKASNVGYVAPNDPGTYVITVVDGRDVYGRTTVQVSSAVMGLDGSVTTDRGTIRSGIVVDGISRPERRVLIDQSAHVELSFPLEIPDDGRKYNTYGALIYTPPGAEGMMLFRTSNLMNPFVVYTDGDLPLYTNVDSGSSTVVDFYRGQLKGIPGVFQFFIAYSPEGESFGPGFILNSEPYVLEVK